jgi:hypothetical protein
MSSAVVEPQEKEMAEFGSDANIDGVEHIDLTRCRKTVELFDMYFDKYGKGAVQKIDFGYGQANPRLWGNKPKKDKKRK